MSSSDRIGAQQFFEPDVNSVGKGEFVPQLPVAMIEFDLMEDEDHPVPMEEFTAPPTPEEVRRSVEKELYEQLESQVETLRREDTAAFQEIAQRLQAGLDARLDRIARRAIELSMAVAERLIRDRIDRDPAVVERALRGALTSIETETRATVVAHPDDASYLRSQDGLFAELGIDAVVEDPSQRRGGCLIDVDRAGYDLSVVTQLRTLLEDVDRILEES